MIEFNKKKFLRRNKEYMYIYIYIYNISVEQFVLPPFNERERERES